VNSYAPAGFCSTGETRRVALAKKPVNINTIVSHLKSLNTNKTTTNAIGNTEPCLEQAHTCGDVKLVKDINTLSS